MTDFSDVNVKSILVEYLKLSDKSDMAEAVEKYCDNTSGIVFNKHPATNEKVFGNLVDYAASANPTSLASFVSNGIHSFEKLTNEIGNKIKSSCNTSESSYKPVNCVCRSDREVNMSAASIEKLMGNPKHNAAKRNRLSNENTEDADYELLTPEGPGTFLKFIGENYLYVQTKNGKKHCFPLSLIEYNRAYLKKHPLYSINLNYKNLALNHTINILNGKNTNTDLIKTDPTKPSNSKNQFISFEKNMEYLKNWIKQEELDEEETIEKDYQIHLYAKEKELKDHTEGILSIKDPSCNPIKKNIYVHSVMNEYKLQKVTPYEFLGEAVLEKTHEPKTKLCC